MGNRGARNRGGAGDECGAHRVHMRRGRRQLLRRQRLRMRRVRRGRLEGAQTAGAQAAGRVAVWLASWESRGAGRRGAVLAGSWCGGMRPSSGAKRVRARAHARAPTSPSGDCGVVH
jgi:hypothetical protein